MRRGNWLAWLAAILVTLAYVVLMIAPALSHDADGSPNWITRGAYVGADNVHCCGPSDCYAIEARDVTVTPQGYVLKTYNDELVPFAEATPSEDHKIWRCKRSDGSRRCFFAPIGGS